jgi:hypothetical protein
MNGYIATFTYQDRKEDASLQANNMQSAIAEAFALMADAPGITGFSVTRLEKIPEAETETP